MRSTRTITASCTAGASTTSTGTTGKCSGWIPARSPAEWCGARTSSAPAARQAVAPHDAQRVVDSHRERAPHDLALRVVVRLTVPHDHPASAAEAFHDAAPIVDARVPRFAHAW